MGSHQVETACDVRFQIDYEGLRMKVHNVTLHVCILYEGFMNIATTYYQIQIQLSQNVLF